MVERHVEQFQELGFAVVRGIFAAEEVRALAAACDRLYARGLAGTPGPHPDMRFRLADDRGAGRIVRMAQWPSFVDPVFDRVRLDPRLLALLAPLLGDDLKQVVNQVHWKPPGAAEVEFGWHQDIRSRRPRAAFRAPATSYVQLGIAVDPHGSRNGALRFCPGSHRLGELDMGIPGRIMDHPLADGDLERLGLAPEETVELALDPGDVALWTLFTVHGSGPNRSDRDRRFYINGYVAAAHCDLGRWAFRRGRPCPLAAAEPAAGA